MKTKYKLDLSPLPEEIADFSQYEQQEFLWGRISLFLIFIVVIISLTINWLFFGEDVQTSDLTMSSNSVQSLMQLPPTHAGVPLKEKTLVKKGKALAKPTKQVPVVQKKQTVKEVALTPSLESDSSISKPKEMIDPALLNVVKPASVLILNSSIKRANLSLSLKDNQPGKALNHSVIMPSSGIIKVILFTAMGEIRGRTLFHDWYRNGVRQSRVKIPVNVNNQNSYSSKYINKQMLGQWQVKVIDSTGEPYIEADFEVINGSQK